MYITFGWGGGQSPGNKLGLWLLYILYDFFFDVTHSALEVTSILL